MMRIGILGTGTMAEALGAGWARAGHELAVGGRSQVKAQALADRLGGAVRAVTPREAVTGRDAVLLAVLWEGVEDILRSAGAADGALDGTPLIDPTNAVEHGVGVLRTESGGSAAQRIAALAPGAHVVKAFHLFPAEQWVRPPSAGEAPATVAMCGDDPAALRVTSELVRDVGGIPTVLGPLDRVRQLEEVAGFVIGLAFAGFDPRSAIPRVPAPPATDPGRRLGGR
jgi:predicted dinucleotide-binding enzyme